jgi:hypothetical protein
VTDDGRRHDELRRQVGVLAQQVAELRRRLDGAARGTDVVRLGEDLGRLAERTVALDVRLGERDRAARDLEDRLGAVAGRLEDRLARLEGVARSAPGARHADLGADADVRTLAGRAEHGAARAAALLDEERRSALRAAVAEEERIRAERDRAVEDLVAASLVIARSEPDASARAAAVLGFGTARAAVEEHRRAQRQVAGAADRARRELEADRRRAAEARGAIEDGRAAHAELVARARARLADALDRNELPPTWLDAALGPAPADRGRWLDTGASLLAYRWVYGLTGAPALGEPPGPDASARRRQWYRELTERSRPAP